MEYQGQKIWESRSEVTDRYRSEYVKGILEFVQRKNAETQKIREDFLTPEKLLWEEERYRKMYRKMLGLDVYVEYFPEKTTLEYIGTDDRCDIYHLVVYVTEEIPFYAMLLLPKQRKEGEKLPLMIAQHGGYGTPELCSDMEGKNNYNHMVQRTLDRHMAVLAPQLMLWSLSDRETARGHAIPYDRIETDINLKRFGGSITAMEISGIQRCLDAVCELPKIDRERIMMIGLSYGGYFTLYTMAADTRIKAGYTAGGFNDRDAYPWSDWCYQNSALQFQDAEVAGLCAPRRLYVTVGKRDEVFTYSTAKREAERVKKYYRVFGCEENFRFEIWDGGHTIPLDREGYDFLCALCG